MDKHHRLILLDADLRVVHARLAKKFNADVAQVGEHLNRNQTGEVSNASIGPSSNDEGPETA